MTTPTADKIISLHELVTIDPWEDRFLVYSQLLPTRFWVNKKTLKHLISVGMVFWRGNGGYWVTNSLLGDLRKEISRRSNSSHQNSSSTQLRLWRE